MIDMSFPGTLRNRTCSLHAPLCTHVSPAQYWSDPHDFQPQRFADTNVVAGSRDGTAFIPFSLGARSCIGRRCLLFTLSQAQNTDRPPDRFAETETVAFIVAFLSRYRVSLPDTREWVGLSKEETRKKLFGSAFILTLTPKSVPLVFARRI